MSIRIFGEGPVIKQVESFKYLGSIITENADSEKNNNTRIRKILKSISMNIELNQRILKCFVWSTFMYGFETQTIKIDRTET